MDDKNDMNDQSLDDVLEAERGATEPSVGKEKLPEDHDSPAAPSSESDDYTIASDHQALDARSNIDSHEEYDEGTVRAAEAGENSDGQTLNPGE